MKFQFIWWGSSAIVWPWVNFMVFKTELAKIYKWSLILGPIEIRRWV